MQTAGLEPNPILRVRDLSKHFTTARGARGPSVKAVESVSLTVYEGEIYGLVGESGCGKSTLGRLMINLLQPTSGYVSLMGQTLTNLREWDLLPLRRYAQMVFQDPYTSLDPRQRVGDILMEALKIHKEGSRSERMDRAMRILQKVGLLPEHFYRFPHEFSGGQRQRIGLARALILEPRLIICDEPVSALDVSIQAQIINLLKALRKEDQTSYVFIAHDMSVVRHIADRVGVMYLGHLVEEALSDALFANPLHPYTQALLSAVPSTNPHLKKTRIRMEGEPPSPLNPPPGCVFHTRCPHALSVCRQTCPQLIPLGGRHKVACHYVMEARHE